MKTMNITSLNPQKMPIFLAYHHANYAYDYCTYYRVHDIAFDKELQKMDVELSTATYYTTDPRTWYTVDGEHMRWIIDGRYPKPNDFVYKGVKYEFELVGNSGKMSRRIWCCKMARTTHKVTIIHYYAADDENSPSLCGGEKRHFKLRLDGFKDVSVLEQEFYDADYVVALTAYLEQEEKRLALENFGTITKFEVVKEANKYMWYDHLDDIDGKLCYILHTYRTTCNNVTLLLHPITEDNVLHVPDEYKGLVIGKGGSNIKALCAKYNKKFKLA